MSLNATAVEKIYFYLFSNTFFILRCHSSYLFSALELAHCANQRIACASQCSGVPLVLQAEPVQGAGEQAGVVANLCAVPKLQQS